MERLAEWYRLMPSGQGATISAEAGQGSVLNLGFHAVKTLLFRAILRPFQDHTAPRYSTTDAITEFETAHMQVRFGAKACAQSFTAFVQGLGLGDFHSFWPFCKLPLGYGDAPNTQPNLALKRLTPDLIHCRGIIRVCVVSTITANPLYVLTVRI